jgi:hypothetical protein
MDPNSTGIQSMTDQRWLMACQEAGVQVDDPSNMYPYFQTSIAKVVSRRVFKPSNFTVRYYDGPKMVDGLPGGWGSS